MSDVSGLLVGGLKIAFVALLWLFIGLVAGVVRRDLLAGSTDGGAQTITAGAGGPNPKRRGRAVKQAQLVVIDGSGKGDAVPLRGEITVGRAGDATLDVEDDYASSHHARFYRDDESWIVADLGSTNGTVVNGLRIARPTRVGDGDIVRIGRTSIKVVEP